MDRRERFLTALEMREPDRVPITELAIDPPIIEAITGGQWIEGGAEEAAITGKPLYHNLDMVFECYRKVGFDMVLRSFSTPEDWRPEVFPDGSFTDEWGRICLYDKRAKTATFWKSPIKTPEDFEAHPFPDPHAPGRYEGFEYLVKLARDEMAVAGSIRTPLAMAWEIFNVTNFCRLLMNEPDFIKKVIRKITDFNIEVIKVFAELGADLIICGGDIAEKRGPLLAPRYFQEIIFPEMRREVEEAHKKGLKYIKHTDGNLYPILDGLAEVVDGLHSLDPSAGMDIGYVKERYGDSLILMGNVSADNLCRASKEEVIEETRECIRKAAPGGGYILTSSNSWYVDAKLENCLAMVETGKIYGKYPINL